MATYKSSHCFVLALTKERSNQLRYFYRGQEKKSPNTYTSFYAEGDDFNLSIYKKEDHMRRVKVVFAGLGASEQGKKWEAFFNNRKANPVGDKYVPKPKIEPSELSDGISKHYASLFPQIGSDEVGIGNYFGPIIVVASYVRESDLRRIEELGITDSKKMKDDYISLIAPILKSDFIYKAETISAEAYNDLYDKIGNLNAIKAILHNKALFALKSRYDEAHVYMDQFADEAHYYNYLKEEKDIVKGIVFKTHGELAFPSVALSSVIARALLLEEMDKLNDEYGFAFPFGNDKKVDDAAVDFSHRFGFDELHKVAKAKYQNTIRIEEKLG